MSLRDPSRTWRIIRDADDVTEEMEEQAADLAASNYADRGRLPTEEFIDAFCRFYGGTGYDPGDWDIEGYDSPAVRKIMRAARDAHREARS